MRVFPAGLTKCYRVLVEGRQHPRRTAELTPAHCTAMRQGVAVQGSDAPMCAEHVAVVDADGAGRTLLDVVLAEGRRREVRRLLQALGFRVLMLARTRIGPLQQPVATVGTVTDAVRLLRARYLPCTCAPCASPSPCTCPGPEPCPCRHLRDLDGAPYPPDHTRALAHTVTDAAAPLGPGALRVLTAEEVDSFFALTRPKPTTHPCPESAALVVPDP